VIFVFLVLSAMYESWTLPIAIILIVPMSVLAALIGVDLRGMDNNILTQIGLVVLIGLAAKNAILIVEFARHRQEHGENMLQAIVESCRLRLRPILMTSFAFILGVVPLVIATGPVPKCVNPWGRPCSRHDRRYILRPDADPVRCGDPETHRSYRSANPASHGIHRG